MQLLQRASSSGPAIHLLSIFCACCALVHLINLVYTTSGESCGLVASLIAVWSVVGGSGSHSLILTFLCIKFQDTNSMSVPRRNFKRLYSLFKPSRAVKKAPILPKGKDKNHREKTDRKGRKEKTYRQVRKKDGSNKLRKSKHNFLPDISTTGVYPTTSPTDHAGIRNRVNPPLPTQHSKLLSQGHKEEYYVPPFFAELKDKRKPGRRGKNADEFPASTSYISSIGSALMGNAFMNQNEEEVLRRKILAKVEELDPLMCLPKVLCGYSSRRRHKNYSRLKTTTTTTTSTTQKPSVSDSVIDEYLHLLGIIRPIPRDKVEDDLKEADLYIKSKKYLKKSSKEGKRVGKKKKKKKYESEEDNNQQEQSGSASASIESDERRTRHQRYPYQPQTSYPYPTYPLPMRHSIGYPLFRRPNPYAGKFLFNRNKESEENDIDEGDDDSEINDDDDGMDEPFNDEEINYIVKKKQMENLMTSGSHSDENWWEPFDNPTMPSYYYPPTQPTLPPHMIPNDELLSTDDGGSITGWFSNMFSNFMPSVSWTGEKKDPDDIKSDPFFTSFDGRSLKNGKSTSSFIGENDKSKLKLPSSSTTNPPLPARKGKRLELKQHFGVRLNSKQLDHTPGDNRDPAAKYRTAVEIGSKVTSPSQCDFIYNGCPLSYEEILVIINESPSHNPFSTDVKGSPETASTTTSTTTKGNITPSLPPQQSILPVHQEQQPSYQPPQTFLSNQQQPQYHILHPQQSSYEQQAHRQQLYSHQQFQQQLAKLPYVLQTPQFQQHQLASAPFSSIEGILSQGTKSDNPHKTQIHQALPSGEVEINLRYQPEKRRKPYFPQGNFRISDNFNTRQDTMEEMRNPYSAAASISNSYEHSQQIDPFNHKVLSNYEFSPSNGYKIRRKNEEDSDIDKDVKVVSNTIKIGSSFGGSLSESDENNNNGEVVSPPVPEKSKGSTKSKRRQQRKPTKGKGKYQRKQMLKSTSSSAPPLRHSSTHRRIPPQQQSAEGKRKGTKRNGNNMKIMRRKYSEEKRKKVKKGLQNDDNSGGNSGSNNSGAASTSASDEQVEYYKEQLESEYLDKMHKTERKRQQKKKKKRKSHLHKQSSDSIEAKKRLKIAAPNAIYPIYGHPFPPPYAGYYHTLYPSTPTSPSFLSYFFGR